MEKYRVAEHKTVQVDGRNFLFLVADKAIFEMDSPTKDLLTRWSQRKELTQQQAMACLPGLSEDEQEELFQGLVQRRAILPAGGGGTQRIGPEAHTAQIPLKTLILHVTEACNLRCAYCYHTHGNGRSHKGEAMSEDVAESAVDFLFAHSGGHEEVVLVFFGGEPLLNFKTIEHVVDLASRNAQGSGKRVNFAVTTNGTVLTEEIISFLEERGIGVTVSLDGFEGVHDRHRRFPDGSPSYAVILPKVRHLLRQAKKRPVVARVTVTTEPERVSETLDHLLGLGFYEVGFAPVTTGHPGFQLDERDMDQLLAEFCHLSDEFVRAAREGRFFGFSNLADLLVSLHQGEVMNYPCGAGLGLFSVDPRGHLYLCQRFTGQEPFCMGDVYQGFDLDRLARFRKEAEVSNKEVCKTCWARTFCTGGCYHEACVREGSHLKPNLHYCEWIKSWGEVGLKAYCEIAADRPEYLDMLCVSRGYPQQVDG